MAIFGKSKKAVTKVEKTKKTSSEKSSDKSKKVIAVAPVTNVANTVASAIIRPRITEKSGILSQGGVYTFEIVRGANKASVAQAINSLYKVKPVRVSIINLPAKSVFVRGKWGTVAGVRKAVVTLKEGDKIDFI